MKKKISGELVVGLIFVGAIVFLLVFGSRLTGYAVYEDFEDTNEKIDIQIGNNYVPGEEVVFKIVLYDENNNKIEGDINYIIQNYYTEIIKEGSIGSGKEVIFKLPENAVQGPWKISANYKGIEVNRLFNVGGLEKAEIKLDGDILTIQNIGNVLYEKKILIYIGSVDQTAAVFLEIGQTKKIRLTAPDGSYNIKVIEGNEEQTLEFEGVKLTGNVVGLERVLGDSFWKKYPLVVLFLGAIGLVVIVVLGLKMRERFC